MQGNEGLRAVPDTAARGVNDAPQRHTVVWVIQYTQVGHNVADFLALVEAGAAHNFVRNARTNEHIFQRPGGIIRAVHHCNVAKRRPVIGKVVNFLGNKTRLVLLVIRHIADQLLPVP